jgi:hypothetical protein
MRNNDLPYSPLDFSDADAQLRFPFDKPIEAIADDQPPIRSVHPLDLVDRHGRRYEMVVHQSPNTGVVLAYCLRPASLN